MTVIGLTESLSFIFRHIAFWTYSVFSFKTPSAAWLTSFKFTRSIIDCDFGMNSFSSSGKYRSVTWNIEFIANISMSCWLLKYSQESSPSNALANLMICFENESWDGGYLKWLYRKIKKSCSYISSMTPPSGIWKKLYLGGWDPSSQGRNLG